MTSENREMVILNQNETGRTIESQANVYLTTIGLYGCVAVIFYSEKNKRLSLTHVDTKTNLEFLSEELKWMGDQHCKVFLIKNLGDLAFLIRHSLMLLGVEQVTELTSTQGTVVFNRKKGVPQFFLSSDFSELVQRQKEPSPGNKLHQLKYQPQYMMDAVHAQKDTCVRQLNAAISRICSHDPRIAYNESGWSRFELELASDVLSKIQHDDIDEDAKSSVNYVWPRYQRFMQQRARAAATSAEIVPVPHSEMRPRRN